MPFDDEFDQVHNIVRSSLETNGWDVTRADEIVRPRKITDAIVESVLSSDLVVADITGGNPNVFYEIGLAHAAGRDVVLLTQERTIPFDVRVERAVIYRRTKRGLAILAKELRDLTR